MGFSEEIARENWNEDERIGRGVRNAHYVVLQKREPELNERVRESDGMVMA